jgi:uncharacterized OsmC-like protein
MIDTQQIGAAFERNARALAKRPSLGHGTATTTVRIADGLRCEIEEGPWRLTADMPPPVGGSASGPTPGVLGRAALGSCLAIGYVLYAAKEGVPLSGVEVEVEADYDDGALFGVADVAPGYLDVRYAVTVFSDAPESDVLRVLDAADAHSPYRDVFGRAQTLTRTARIVPSR